MWSSAYIQELDTTGDSASHFELLSALRCSCARRRLLQGCESRGILKLRVSILVFLLTVSLTAQQTDTPPAAAPVVEPDQPPPAEYGGPAILSRGGVSSLTSPQKSIRFRPFLSLTASYDT